MPEATPTSRQPAYPWPLAIGRIVVCAIGVAVFAAGRGSPEIRPLMLDLLGFGCLVGAAWTVWVMAIAWIEVSPTALRYRRPRVFDPLPAPRSIGRDDIAAICVERTVRLGSFLVLRLKDGARARLSPLTPGHSFGRIEAQAQALAARLGVPVESHGPWGPD